MFTFLLVVQAIIAAALVTVILMQKSEGGGLTSGGSPSGLMSARGAADFLTRSTAVLAFLFVSMSIALSVIAAGRQSTTVDTSLARKAPLAPASTGPAPADQGAPFATAAQNAAAAAAQNSTPPADNGVPLAR
ncbi:Preprotein translocase subunit SecG [Sphingomonas sp. EC-HK361]|uniref:preprotein translocase subunit SecG n=1 Tax=Sphingomonas sp. EC-HK361 TaxID=2038397 RepID=UPI00125259AC|nr:preprotein translocase subunit SecG [Sphingomonas sp. EC-HK361]VVT11160.1 Preprotein translocase subunit SecG [Sphingomonas sp. EC-HK361]